MSPDVHREVYSPRVRGVCCLVMMNSEAVHRVHLWDEVGRAPRHEVGRAPRHDLTRDRGGVGHAERLESGLHGR